jgi:hypothetical protein
MRTHAKWLTAIAFTAGVLNAPHAQSQATPQLTGSLNITSSGSNGGSAQALFTCNGADPCTGMYTLTISNRNCSNAYVISDAVVISGLNLVAPGPVAGSITLRNGDFSDRQNGDGTCTIVPGSQADFTLSFTGTWNGSYGALAFTQIVDNTGTVISTTGTISTKATTGTQVSGTFASPPGDPDIVQGSFDCTGTPMCTGQYKLMAKASDCANAVYWSGAITFTGLNLDQSGAIQGGIVISNLGTQRGPNDSCAAASGSAKIATYTGTWDLASGTGSFTIISVNGQGGQDLTPGTIRASTSAPTPVFPMTVTTNITPTVSSATANIQFRPQDLGTSGSVYAFAVAPSTLAKAAADGSPHFVVGKSQSTDGNKDTPVACVLAQLTGSGQLQAVSASSLAAYVSGVLSSAGQSVQVINGVATANIAGATFYVGYGTNASAMLNSGVNRSVVTVPGSSVCQPQPPQTGWWWNAAESGRGYTIEASGNKLFIAAYLYDASGRSTWYISAGNSSLDGSLYTGNLELYNGGQALTGTYHGPNLPPTIAGQVVLTFNDAQNGTITLPGGSPVAIQRFAYGAGGPATPALASQPENGWWWSTAESGRGYFIEWQGSIAYMAGYMYDVDGHSVWYVTPATTPQPQSLSGMWTQFANGQTLAGPYRKPDQSNANVGAGSISFSGAADGIMTLPGGRQIPITRYRF